MVNYVSLPDLAAGIILTRIHHTYFNMLKIRSLNFDRAPFWVTERNFTIGRSDTNNLTLEDPSVDNNHARIQREKDAIVLRDLNSATGTYVNGERVNARPISCGDSFRLGNLEFEVMDPIAETLADGNEYWSLIGDSSWLAGQEFPLDFSTSSSLLLGRGKQCDIVFAGTHLSREHARITRVSGTELILEDLKSANSTFLNDKKVERAPLKAGDQIRLDVYSFRLFGRGIRLHKSATRPQQTPLPGDHTEKPRTPAEQKRWKTAPTSPGNREEPAAQTSSWVTWFIAFLLVLLLAAVLARVLLL